MEKPKEKRKRRLKSLRFCIVDSVKLTVISEELVVVALDHAVVKATYLVGTPTVEGLEAFA